MTMELYFTHILIFYIHKCYLKHKSRYFHVICIKSHLYIYIEQQFFFPKIVIQFKTTVKTGFFFVITIKKIILITIIHNNKSKKINKIISNK